MLHKYSKPLKVGDGKNLVGRWSEREKEGSMQCLSAINSTSPTPANSIANLKCKCTARTIYMFSPPPIQHCTDL